MANLIADLEQKGLAKPPRWLSSNVVYLTIMGSMAYGCNEDESDYDVYGFCVPAKEDIFPHLRGEIPGFGRQLQRFEQYSQHHMHDPAARAGRGVSYDVTCYSIVKYFQLMMENNPNIVDSLFTPRECVIFSTPIAEMVRERRRAFLHRGSWHKFRGYAYSQLSKMANQRCHVEEIRQFEDAHGIPHTTPYAAIEQERLCRTAGVRSEGFLEGLDTTTLNKYDVLWQHGLLDKGDVYGSKRFPSRKRFGYDVKFAMHLVRLVQEAEQILVAGDIDLRSDSALLRDVRSGNWTEQQVREWFQSRERELEPLYANSRVVPHSPDEQAIKALLLECLEHHYGSLSAAVVDEGRLMRALRDIKAVIERSGV